MSALQMSGKCAFKDQGGSDMRSRGVFLAAYLVVVHLVLAFALLKPDAWTRLIAGSHPNVARTHAVLVAMDRNTPPGSAVFLGDSITQRLPVTMVAADGVNYGIGRQTSVELARHIPEYQAVKTARVVYLMIGINDLAAGKQPNYEAVLSALPSEVPIIWTGVMPARSIQGVSLANSEAMRLCQARPRCTFIEPPIQLADIEDDGVHVLPSGYAKWADELRQHEAGVMATAFPLAQ